EASSFTKHQIELFEEVIEHLKQAGINPGIRHIQNSYGILNYPHLQYEYCRPGLLYMGVTSDDQIPIQT
ncbi:alanine racemase, partial [Acinetobacter baumannii]|nr:alanine racemase [Acinetobacter baumannii]